MPLPAIDADLGGRLCLVTGASSGIGKAAATGLARLGARVILACRDAARGELARREIQLATGKTSLEVLPVDLGSRASTRDFAGACGERFERLDVLVNNAGLWSSRRRLSGEGIELTWALARRLEATGITANALHPGGVDTGIFRKGGGVRGLLGSLWAKGFGRTPEQGADTAVWLAASAAVDGISGRFYRDRAERPCHLRDLETEERLFALCESYSAPQPWYRDPEIRLHSNADASRLGVLGATPLASGPGY